MKDRRYVILRKDLNSGEIRGYCENSFSMSFELNRAKVYGNVLKQGVKQSEENFVFFEKNKKRYSRIVRAAKTPNQKLWLELQETVACLRENNKDNPYEYKVFRLGGRCPVEMDFSEIERMKKKKMGYDKYKWRNQPIMKVCLEKW